MLSDDAGKQLHDKATRGLELSAEERALLTQWYARLDEEESRQLAGALPSLTLGALQSQIDYTLAQLVTLTQRIQTLAAENEGARHEAAALQEQLSRKRVSQRE